MSSTKLLIGVVGPCKSGKSTLVRGLGNLGYEAVHIAQEHSFAPRMWQQIAQPDVLIYLDCSYPTTVKRGLNWTQPEFEEQQPRLQNARQHANLLINTDDLSADVVLDKVKEFLAAKKKPE